MKHALLLLLVTLSTGAYAQQEQAYYGPFSPQHQEKKERERHAIALRVSKRLRAENDRDEVERAANRRRCQAALRVAELCGKFAGTFYCDENGFESIPVNVTPKPAVLDSGGRYRMERCALDAARLAR